MDIQPVDILKWIGLVLAAGFIGYFGRYLSMLLIDRIHKRKSEPTIIVESTSNAPNRGEDNSDKEKAKLEKKRLKQQSKIAKKGIQ